MDYILLHDPHDFIFGASIFNFNQLGTEEHNQKYKDLFGILFNRATSDTIESAIWRDIQKEKALEEQKRKEQMPRKLSDRLQWGRERSQEHNMHQKKNKIKHKEMEL